MTIREFIGRIMAWRRRDELDRELSEELEAHVELMARDLAASGMAPVEALAAARRQVGNVTSHREQSRDWWGFPRFDAVVQDIRYALRGLRRSPGFTITVIVTLALGIGANAAIFGVIDRAMFRPYPYTRDPGSISRVYLQTTIQGRRNTNTVFPWRRYQDLSSASSVGRFAAQTEWRLPIGSGADTRIGRVTGISASFFSFFDAVPVLGRWFTEAEDQPGAGAPVAIIGHAMWRNQFGGADIIGRPLKVGVIHHTIIGVAPPGFVAAVAGGAPDIIVPVTSIPANLGAWSSESYRRDYRWDWIQVFVRRAPGVSEDAASQVLSGAYVQSRASARALNPRVLPDSLAHPRALAGPVRQAAGPDPATESRVMLWASGVAAIVLIIACANVANLMFARVLRRRREVSLRLALGVRRGRLIGQFLVEGVVLAFAGCGVGLLIAQWGGSAIRGMLLADSASFNLARDARTLAVAALCATVAALVTTIGPALMATRANLSDALKSGAREGGYRRSALRSGLVVLQGSLSVLLLVGAGLFVRSFGNARGVPLGYDARPVLEVIPDFRGFEMDSAAAAAMRERLLQAAQSLPGVSAAARVNSRLFGTNVMELHVDGIDSVAALGRFNIQVASPDYFDVMEIRLLRGRLFDAGDREAAERVTVVSEAMARVLWPGRDALGQCLHVGSSMPEARRAPCTRVVGVAANTVQRDLVDDPQFMYYMPVAQQWPDMVSTLYLRLASAEARGEVERVRRELSRAMPGDGFVVVRPLQEVVDDQSRSWRLGATLFSAFGVLALVVAIVGLYGLVSYDVAQRSHELGVRVALGAKASDVAALVLKQGMGLAALGVVTGIVAALIAARWVQPLLFQHSARDAATYLGVSVAMLFAALAANLIPAIRAQRVDPNTVLRAE